MSAVYVKLNKSIYQVRIVGDDRKVQDSISFSSLDEYQAWKETYREGTVHEFFKDQEESTVSPPVPGDPDPTEAAPVPPIDPADLESTKQQLFDRGFYVGKGVLRDPVMTPSEALKEDTEKQKLDRSKKQNEIPLQSNATKKNKKSGPSGKASLDKGDFTPSQKLASEKSENAGLLYSQLYEPVPDYKACDGDRVVSGKNNQWLVFGRDRPGGYVTGYGPGSGDTQAGAIDIVVGRMSPHVRSANRDGSRVKVSPIFGYSKHENREVCDAARIYISQKTDVDTNFLLAGGSIGNRQAISAIALKSDAVRIIARDSGIKLITQERTLMNSQGHKSSKQPSGIDIIAGNNDANLQPMVLGNNLTHVLKAHHQLINEIVGIITSLIENISKLDLALASHVHPQSFPPGLPTIPDIKLLATSIESIARLTTLDTFSAFAAKFDLERMDKIYLASGGSKSIRSKFNNVN